MEERKTFTYDGMNSADFDLYIAGDSVYDAPTRDMDMITIPGRNGQLSIDQGRFENITVTYPAFVWADTQEEFRTKVRAIRNWLCAKTSYFKLSDEYNPESYRLGIYKSGLEVEPIFYNRAGRFELSFDCKPQRFLFSGEEVFTLGEWGETETYSGSIVSFDGTETTAIKSLKVNIVPKQSGSGWDAVAVNHTGKNLLPPIQDEKPLNGVTPTLHADGSVTLNGTATANANFYGERITLKAGTYIVSGGDETIAGTCVLYLDGASGTTDTGGGKRITLTEDTRIRGVVRVYSGKSVSNVTLRPMIRLATESAEYEPYNGSTITIDLPQTVTNGTLDVVSGKLILSPSGTEIQLSPTEVNTLLGSNNIWADAGTVEVEVGENPNILVNPTPFTAQPIFEVEGSGTLTVNNSSMTIANNGTTVIDSEMMEAYEEENGAIISRNDMVSGEFPTLKEGNNSIGTVGLTSVKVKPRWWEV